MYEHVRRRIIERNPWYVGSQLDYSYGPARYIHGERVRFILKAIQQINTRPISLLDIGCGDGVNLFRLVNSGKIEKDSLSLWGIDYNPLRIHRAKNLVKSARFEHVAIGTSWVSPIRAGFDVLLLSHVLEHVLDDHAALRWAKRYISPRGVLILLVPNEGSLLMKLSRFLQIFSKTDHVNFYTKETIEKKLHKAGWEAIAIEPESFAIPQFHLRMLMISQWPTYVILEKLGQLFPSQSSGLRILCRPI